jgi:hypothetical protein
VWIQSVADFFVSSSCVIVRVTDDGDCGQHQQPPLQLLRSSLRQRGSVLSSLSLVMLLVAPIVGVGEQAHHGQDWPIPR